MRPHPFLVLALVGALLGFIFAGFSTYDFEQHLDRQVHSVHCSFVPGLGEEEAGGSDCEVTLMSPYSSVLRAEVWGGVPISLPAMSVFAFLLFFGVDLLLGRRQRDRRATGLYALATLVPVGASVVMGAIALGELDAACKLCIGIYVSSAIVFTGALGLWLSARGQPSAGGFGDGLGDEPAWSQGPQGFGGDEADDAELLDSVPGAFGSDPYAPASRQAPMSFGKLAGMFGLGVLFVAMPVVAYMLSAPDHSAFIGTCGSIAEQPADELVVPLGPQTGVPALEVFDPLCPACRGFEEHLATTPLHDELARRAVLFPLDSACNWMLDRPVHPGACAVSEAVLCAGDQGGGADEVVAWSFAHQDEIMAAATDDPKAAERLVEAEFPGLASCVGSPKAKARLNRSLRWAVDNQLRVLTPQLYVDGVRLCDEDVDLGLEFALTRMLELHERGSLKIRAAANEED